MQVQVEAELLLQLMLLLSGIENAQHMCTCRRMYKITFTDELKALLAKLRPQIMRANGVKIERD